MRRSRALAAAVVLLAWAPLRAQDEPGPPAEELVEPIAPAPSEEPAPAMTLADARINLPTVVQAFVEKRAKDGVWSLRDKATGRLRKLRLLTLDAERAKHAGEGLYSAPGLMLDTSTGERLPVVFTVDFSGTEWKVAKMRFVRRRKPAAKARPAN